MPGLPVKTVEVAPPSSLRLRYKRLPKGELGLLADTYKVLFPPVFAVATAIAILPTPVPLGKVVKSVQVAPLFVDL